MIVVGARLFAALALAVWIALSAGQLPAFAQPADDPLRHGYALLIGISHYRDGGWGQLEDVPVEIDKLKAGLARHFDSVETALDLTESEMESRIRKFLDDHENEGDSRLLIYYSGHGYTETFKQYGERRGFVTGVDTPAPDGSRDAYNKARGRALSMNEIRQMLSDSPAHAVMMIFDSCFSGTIFTDRSPNELGPSTSDRVKQWMAQPARDILTAGDSTQKVPAQSPMPDLLLSAIDGGADKYGFGVVSASDIEIYLRANLNGVNLTPHAGRLDRPAFAEGRFLFRVPGARTSPGGDSGGAVVRLQTAADQSQPEAQFNLGLAKMRGEGGAPADKREGVRLIKLAADQGYTEAEAALGSYYITGEGGLGVNKREAVRLFRRAADKGNTFAQVSLGTAYWRGDGGLPSDTGQAVSLWRKAVDKQDVEAQVHLGISYLQGQGIPRDTVEGVRLLQLAADQGNPSGAVNLGLAYQRGDGGLPRNLFQAVSLFRKAADQGLPEGAGPAAFPSTTAKPSGNFNSRPIRVTRKANISWGSPTNTAMAVCREIPTRPTGSSDWRRPKVIRAQSMR